MIQISVLIQHHQGPTGDVLICRNTDGGWEFPHGKARTNETDEEAAERMDMVWEFVRDYNLGLFKMDGVCGPLRPSKYDYFEQMMASVRHP